MGYYIDPPRQSKEEFLAIHGTPTGAVFPTDPELALVCLVDNGFFTAAAIMFAPREAAYFNDPTDPRPKKWFTVPKAAIAEAMPQLRVPYIVPDS